MKKPAMTLLLLLFVTLCLAQQNRKASIYISAQYSETLYDRVKPNNPNLFGLGVQVYLRNASPLKPTAEVTAELVGPRVHVLYLDENGDPINGFETMVNIFGGASYHPVRPLYVSFTGGLALLDGNTYLGIKPSIGCYFSRSQRVTAKVSYLNVFDRTRNTGEDFGALTVSVGLRIF